jgi:hypothetical protein
LIATVIHTNPVVYSPVLLDLGILADLQEEIESFSGDCAVDVLLAGCWFSPISWTFSGHAKTRSRNF